MPRFSVAPGDFIWGEPPKGTIFIYSGRPTVSKLLRDIVDDHYIWMHVVDPRMWPPRSHFYITHVRLCTEVERAAASILADPVVLPEMSEYLREQLAHRVAARTDTFIFQATSKGETPLWATGKPIADQLPLL